MNIVKRFFYAYVAAREFEVNMNIMDSMRETKTKYPVKVTLDQMNILTACASLGISKSVELFDHFEDIKDIVNSRKLHSKKA